MLILNDVSFFVYVFIHIISPTRIYTRSFLVDLKGFQPKFGNQLRTQLQSIAIFIDAIYGIKKRCHTQHHVIFCSVYHFLTQQWHQKDTVLSRSKVSFKLDHFQSCLRQNWRQKPYHTLHRSTSSRIIRCHDWHCFLKPFLASKINYYRTGAAPLTSGEVLKTGIV